MSCRITGTVRPNETDYVRTLRDIVCLITDPFERRHHASSGYQAALGYQAINAHQLCQAKVYLRLRSVILKEQHGQLVSLGQSSFS